MTQVGVCASALCALAECACCLPPPNGISAATFNAFGGWSHGLHRRIPFVPVLLLVANLMSGTLTC